MPKRTKAARPIKPREERLIEIRFALAQIKAAFDPATYADDTPFVGHDESDRVKAFLHTIFWKKGSRGALIAQLMDEALADPNHTKLHPAPMQELTTILEERLPDDIDFSK